jgi:hypothetical protein
VEGASSAWASDAHRHSAADAAAVHHVAVCQRQGRWLANLSLYEKYNTLVWELVSHLWFLLVLVVLTTISVLIFSRLRHHLSTTADTFFASITLGNCRCSFCCWASRMRR